MPRPSRRPRLDEGTSPSHYHGHNGRQRDYAAAVGSRRTAVILPELVDETVATEVDVDAVHDMLATLLFEAYRARP